jgi:LmbE family N-acetylglucosaminyl deacetylase
LEAKPDFAVDISAQMEQKLQSVLAYKTQFFNPDSKEENTFISSPEFLDFVKARATHFGVPLGVKFAEGFTVNRTIGVADVMNLF